MPPCVGPAGAANGRTGSPYHVRSVIDIHLFAPQVFAPGPTGTLTADHPGRCPSVHSFVVVVAKGDAPVPPTHHRLLAHASLPELVFAADDHLAWTDRSGRIAVYGWQAGTGALAMGSHWHVDERGCTAFTRPMWPRGTTWSGGATWAAQLHARAVGRPWPDGQPYDGIFAALSIAADGTGTIATDPTSMGLLFRAEDAEVVAFSSRAALAARATSGGRAPDRDVEAVGWLTFYGAALGERTGFRGTELVPQGARVELSAARGARLVVPDEAPWRTGDLPTDRDALLDAVVDDLGGAVRSCATLPARQRRAEITGGKDSRLILALMEREGVAADFAFATIGRDDAPDVVVSKDITARMGLEHTVETPVRADPDDFLRRLRLHVFQSSAAFNAYNLGGGSGLSLQPQITGLFGEVLRTNYGRYPEVATRDDLRAVAHAHMPRDLLGILRPDVRRTYARRFDALLLGPADEDRHGQDLLDDFYIRQHMRWWGGSVEESATRTRLYPLLSLLGMQAAAALGPASRRAEEVPREVMARASAALAAAPFAEDAWAGAVAGATRTARTAAGAASAPVPRPAAPRGPAPQPWQVVRLEAQRDAVEALLLDDPANPVFDLVDRRALTAVLMGIDAPRTVSQWIQVYGVLTAAVWLGGSEGGDQAVERARRDVVRPAAPPPVASPSPAPPRPAHPPRLLRPPVRRRLRRPWTGPEAERVRTVRLALVDGGWRDRRRLGALARRGGRAVRRRLPGRRR